MSGVVVPINRVSTSEADILRGRAGADVVVGMSDKIIGEAVPVCNNALSGVVCILVMVLSFSPEISTRTKLTWDAKLAGGAVV